MKIAKCAETFGYGRKAGGRGHPHSKIILSKLWPGPTHTPRTPTHSQNARRRAIKESVAARERIDARASGRTSGESERGVRTSPHFTALHRTSLWRDNSISQCRGWRKVLGTRPWLFALRMIGRLPR